MGMKEFYAKADQLIDAIDEFLADLDNGKVKNMVLGEFTKDVASDIKYIFDMYVQKYYDAYTPKYYGSKRKYRLFDMYEIKIKGYDVHWTIAPDLNHYPDYERFRDPQAGGEYIFNFMFEKGFHGGANSGPPDALMTPFYGSDKDLLWRKPQPGGNTNGFKPYSLWGRHAEKTFSPSDRIGIDLQRYQNNDKKNMSGTTQMERYMEAWEHAERKYKLFDLIRR